MQLSFRIITFVTNMAAVGNSRHKIDPIKLGLTIFVSCIIFASFVEYVAADDQVNNGAETEPPFGKYCVYHISSFAYSALKLMVYDERENILSHFLTVD